MSEEAYSGELPRERDWYYAIYPDRTVRPVEVDWVPLEKSFSAKPPTQDLDRDRDLILMCRPASGDRRWMQLSHYPVWGPKLPDPPRVPDHILVGLALTDGETEPVPTHVGHQSVLDHLEETMKIGGVEMIVEWRSMESAPRDGTKFLVCDVWGGYYVCMWMRCGSRYLDEDGVMVTRQKWGFCELPYAGASQGLVAWMPLPALPPLPEECPAEIVELGEVLTEQRYRR